MSPSTAGFPPINEVFAADENNRRQVAESMGDSVLALPKDVAGLYHQHYEAVRHSFSNKPATFAGLLYVSCCQSLTMAVMSLLRRYSSQAFRETRVAVETAGIAHEITKNDESFEVFLADRGDIQCRRVARNRFQAKTLFRDGAAALTAAYYKASELSHQNRRSLITHVNSTAGMYTFQDLPDHAIPLVATNHLLCICFTHMTILQVADSVFPDIENEALLAFRKERQFVGERLARFHQANQQDIADSTHANK